MDGRVTIIQPDREKNLKWYWMKAMNTDISTYIMLIIGVAMLYAVVPLKPVLWASYVPIGLRIVVRESPLL